MVDLVREEAATTYARLLDLVPGDSRHRVTGLADPPRRRVPLGLNQPEPNSPLPARCVGSDLGSATQIELT